MKGKTRSIETEKFVEQKPKMCSPLVDNSENKKKSVVATINQNEYKDVFLNDK